MIHRLLSTLTLAALIAAPSAAYAQATTQLIGTVVDASGASIPGATVEAKHKGTNAVLTTVTSSQGSFTIPALQPGTYTVTVTLQGFKTAVLNDVVANVGVPAVVRATLEVGGLSETVVVEAATAVVQTSATDVSSTINTKQITSLPLTSRNVLDFITFLPGVNTPGGNRDSTVNGLPQSAINITLDGINVQDNTLKSTDGFFTIVQPRLDAIEEVTVTGAAGGASGAGQGAVQIAFVTKSGTNTYSGSGYHYFRSDKLNENTWFNERNKVTKPKLLQNQTGGRLGGPVLIPGLYDGRGKMFFFFNVEEFRQPSDVTRTRTILHPRAQEGFYRYDVGGGVIREINVLTLPGGLTSFDPTIQKLLADIRTATGTTGSVSDVTNPQVQEFAYNVPVSALNYFPTFRGDYNITTNHRFSATLNWHTFSSVPDTLNGLEPAFPGFPVFGSQTSTRIQLSTALRSTLGGDLVNELRIGYSGAPVEFFKEQFDAGIWDSSVANQKGFQLGISAAGISNASPGPNAQSRNASTMLIEDTVTWLRGNHSISFGGSVTQVDIWLKNQTTVPSIAFDVLTADPARAMFNTTNFPGASGPQLTAARQYYATLVGSVSQITGNAGLDETTGKYVYQGPRLQRGQMRDAGFYVQDSWRAKPNLTINYGLRYELQLPFSAANSLYSTTNLEGVWGPSGYAPGCDASDPTVDKCNLFKPGVMPGLMGTAVFTQLTAGTSAYDTDRNNWAPSFGVNWTPSTESGFLRSLMGQPGDFAIRGGWSRSFNREGMTNFTGVYNANPGILITANKSEGVGNLGALPVLLRNPGQVTPASFPESPTYPLSDVITGDVNTFAPNLQVPYADSYTIGMQRGLTRNMAVEVRYVGTRSRALLANYNLNEINIHENGFLDEFKLAQANLQAHIATGCVGAACSFAYRGPGTGTSPLPIYLSYFTGLPAAQAGNCNSVASCQVLYAGTNWTNSTFVNPLALRNPNPFNAAGSLDDDPVRRANALLAGRPANFLLANPNYLGGANITGNGGFSDYNSVQMELRRRLANGFQFQANYVYGVATSSQRFSFRVPRESLRQAGGEGEVTHAVKLNWVFELPIGRGKRFGTDFGPVLDRIAGGWQIHGNMRIQSGRLVDFGNVRMVGFDAKELWGDLYKLRINDTQRVFMLPQAIIDETIKAFSISATSANGYGSLGAPSGKYFAPANGSDCIETINNDYGECGVRSLIMRGPMFREVDISIMKQVPISGRTRAEFRFEMLNVFNHVNYVPVTGMGNNVTVPTNYEISGLTGATTARVVQLVTRITW